MDSVDVIALIQIQKLYSALDLNSLNIGEERGFEINTPEIKSRKILVDKAKGINLITGNNSGLIMNSNSLNLLGEYKNKMITANINVFNENI